MAHLLLSLFPRDREVGDPHGSRPVPKDEMEHVACGEVLGLELDLAGPERTCPRFGIGFSRSRGQDRVY